MKSNFIFVLIFLPGLVFGEGFFTASSVVNEVDTAWCAFDGDEDTFWMSRKSNKESGWLQIDLGRVVSVSGVNVSWGQDYAAEYKLQASIDSHAWETIYHCTDGDGGKDQIGSLDGKGRYFRVLCLKYGRRNYYQIHEVAFAGDAGGSLEKIRITIPRR